MRFTVRVAADDVMGRTFPEAVREKVVATLGLLPFKVDRWTKLQINGRPCVDAECVSTMLGVL